MVVPGFSMRHVVGVAAAHGSTATSQNMSASMSMTEHDSVSTVSGIIIQSSSKSTSCSRRSMYFFCWSSKQRMSTSLVVLDDEFKTLVESHGFSGYTAASLSAYNRLLWQWMNTLLVNLNRTNQVTRRDFDVLERRLHPLLAALYPTHFCGRARKQKGGDYYQASEYYGVDSGQYTAPAPAFSDTATAVLARPGLLSTFAQSVQDGGSPLKRACKTPRYNELSAKVISSLVARKNFSDSAKVVVRNMLSVMTSHVLDKAAVGHKGKVLGVSLLQPWLE